MAENTPKDAGKGGMIKNILIVVLLPLAIYGGYSLKGVSTAVKKEVQAGTTWSDVWQKIKAGDTAAFQEMVKQAPKVGAGVVLQKAAEKDEKIRDFIKINVARLMKDGVITQGEGRLLIQDLDEAAAASKSE